jgi:predicted permease
MMIRLKRLMTGFKALFRNQRLERELDEELRAYRETAIEEKVRAGMARDEAIRAAHVQFGSLEAVKDYTRDVGWESSLYSFWRDVRYTFRTLRRTPGFTVAAVLTLALGIGATSAIFTLLNAAVLRPLPVREPEELVWLQKMDRGREDSYFSYPHFERLRERTRTLSGLFATSTLPRVNVVSDGTAGIASGALVSGDYFDVLGVRPELGRLLTREDDRAASPVAVISHGFWRRRSGAATTIVGKSVVLNNVPLTIIGVLPPAFFGVMVGRSPDLILPMRLADRVSGSGSWNQPFVTWLQIIGRVGSGTSEQAARAELTAIYRQSQLEFAGTASDGQQRIAREVEMKIVPASTGLTSSRGVHAFAPALRFLMGIAAMLLLVACANVANLLLARSEARQPEFAVRLAVGASRGRLVRQLVTESALIGLMGGAFGLAFAIWGSRALASIVSAGPLPILLDTHPDLRVLGFTAFICCATVLVFGVAPSFRATRGEPGSRLGTLRAAIGTGHLGWNRTLVVSQVALSLVLVIAAGLFVRTVHNLLSVDAGYNRQNVLMLSTDASLLRYGGGKTPALYGAILDSLGSIPGVARASASFARPIDSELRLVGAAGFVEGQTLDADRRLPYVFNVVGPNYFSTLEIPMLMGRDFGAHDGRDSAKVAIINETLARQLFHGEHPIGLRFGQNPREIVQVIGVVKDTKYANLIDAPQATVYFPITQTPWPVQVTFLTRYTGATGPITEAARQRLAAIDSALPIYRVNTLEIEAQESLLRQRLLATVSSLFGVTTLLLAGVGLYGLMSFAIARRRKEIGVRIALGAERRSVLWMTLRESIGLIAVGIGIGVPSALALMRLARTFLFGLTATDPLTLTTAAALSMGVGVLAAYIPARRAARVDPIGALRNE